MFTDPFELGMDFNVFEVSAAEQLFWPVGTSVVTGNRCTVPLAPMTTDPGIEINKAVKNVAIFSHISQ